MNLLQPFAYLMESDQEVFRLDVKTDEVTTKKQAIWAGIQPGMRVADICCGSGKTTSILYQLVQPNGSVMGIDASVQRVTFAEKHYHSPGIEFVCKDIRDNCSELGLFDFVWVRFVLEYYRKEAFQLVRKLSQLVKSGGILCLIDLDHNCLNHYGLSTRLERTLHDLMNQLMNDANFDPFAGRKLYSHLYRLGYTDINVNLSAHHLIYGKLRDIDAHNWLLKLDVAIRKIDYSFPAFAGDYDEFRLEFEKFFRDPARFTYTPLIACRGRKPVVIPASD